MANLSRNTRVNAAYSFQQAKCPWTRGKSAVPLLQREFTKQQPFVVVHADEKCSLHTFQDICTCSSIIIEDVDEIRNSDRLSQQYVENDDLDSFSTVSLPNSQQDIIDNHLRFDSSLSQNHQTKTHNSSTGSQWRHLKPTNTCSGSNNIFIDSRVRGDNSFKYPIYNFDYFLYKQPQDKVSSPCNDLSFTPRNPRREPSDILTWSASKILNRRPSLSQYSNRFQRHAKENFSYWPTDITCKKSRCKPNSTGTYKTWFG